MEEGLIVELSHEWLQRIDEFGVKLSGPVCYESSLLAGLSARLYIESRHADDLGALAVEGIVLEPVAEISCNPEFAEFLRKELMPWVSSNYQVTSNPARRVIAGSSYGGLAAAYASLRHPELFGNVLAQSGSFWWAPKLDEGEEPNWLARQYVEAPHLVLRFFMEAGIFENDIRGSGGQILETSRHLRDVLRAKGYEVHYREFAGGHDYLSWPNSLADGLVALLGAKR